jgi:parallel beta-helix repeat protein
MKQPSAVSLGSILAILLLYLPCYVQARDFYVSNDGLDKNAGTREEPFRTLARAALHAEGGDTVILRGGIYRETLTVRNSGTDTKPFTFMAAKGEKVVISGADLVGSWKLCKGSILQTKIPKVLDLGFNQLFLDGRMMNQARFPNETSTDLHKPTFIRMSAGDSRITSPLLTQDDGFWNGGFVVGLFDHRWTIQCAKIKDYRADTLSLVGKSRPWYKGAGHGYVSGVLGALDAPGEWHIEDGRLYFWPPEGTDMTSARVEVKRRTLCIDYNGQSHVAVKGINVTAGSVRLVANSCTLESSRLIYPSHFTYFTWGEMASDGGVDKGHNGILVQGTNNTIRGCTIKYSAGTGIVIKGAQNLITRCQISDIDYSGTYSCPISVATAPGMVTGKNRIWFNTIRRTGRDCIQLYGASADDIRYNDISDSGLMCKDLGLVSVYGRDGQGTRIAYNWVHDNRSKGPNPGIYFDNYCRNFIVDHNVIWNCEAGVRVNGPAEGHRIYNNTLFNCDDVGTHTYHVWPPNKHGKAQWPIKTYQYEKANNLFLGRHPQQQLQDVGSLKSWLTPGADAIDSGKPITGFTDGFLGEAPDLGAYESGGARWVPGVRGRAGQGAAAHADEPPR